MSRINKEKARAEFQQEIFKMLMVWKTKQQALQIVKNNEQKIDEWMSPKGYPIVTAAVAARILIIKETSDVPSPDDVRDL